MELFVELDTILKQWQDALTSGLVKEQERIAGQLKDKVNKHFNLVGNTIKSDDRELKLIATGAIGFSGKKEAVPFLLSALTDESELIRTNALLGIGFLGDKETPVTLLVKLLTDESDGVRGAAAFAISGVLEFGKPRGTTESLIKALDDTDASVRNEVVRALAICKDPFAVEPLIKKGLSDENDLIVINTAVALGAIKDTRAIEPLINLLQKENPTLKEASLSALKYITGADYGDDILKWQEWWNKSKQEPRLGGDK
ncbi:MAG: HEAT repeat domain-containing protein [Planctomycetota bacterium]